MKATEEMVLLVIQQRHKWIKEYMNSDWKELYFLSDAEEYISRIKPIVDDMHSLLELYKKEQLEKSNE